MKPIGRYSKLQRPFLICEPGRGSVNTVSLRSPQLQGNSSARGLKMVWIRAIYRCPQSRTQLLIYDDDNLTKPRDQQILRQSKLEIVCPERIRQLIYRRGPTKHLRWTVKLVPASDFLSALNTHKCETLGVSNQSFHNPESFELLAMCLENSPCLSGSSNTPKILDSIPDEDIIQVFI